MLSIYGLDCFLTFFKFLAIIVNNSVLYLCGLGARNMSNYPCDSILKQGVFETIYSNENRNFSENLQEWLKTTNYQEFKEKQDSGLKIGFPIDGVPIQIGGNHSEDNFNNWKESVNQGRNREFSAAESQEIAVKSINRDIVNAWRLCVVSGANNRTGLVQNVEGLDDEILVYTIRYIPDAIDDYPPVMNQFVVEGATSNPGFVPEQEIPYGGVSTILQREERSSITIIANTSKGQLSFIVPELPVRPSMMNLAVNSISGDEYEAKIIGPSDGFNDIRTVKYMRIGFTRSMSWWLPSIKFQETSEPSKQFSYTFRRKKLWKVTAKATFNSGEQVSYRWEAATHPLAD